MLIHHLREPQAIDHRPGTPAERNTANKTRAVLIAHKLAIPVKKGAPRAPRFTVLTDLGREVAAFILAYYAEQLVRAGALDDMRAIKMTPTQWRDMRLMTTSVSVLTDPLPEPAKVAATGDTDGQGTDRN